MCDRPVGCRNFRNWQKAPKQLNEDEADLIIGHCLQYSSWHQRQTPYQENLDCVASLSCAHAPVTLH